MNDAELTTLDVFLLKTHKQVRPPHTHKMGWPFAHDFAISVVLSILSLGASGSERHGLSGKGVVVATGVAALAYLVRLAHGLGRKKLHFHHGRRLASAVVTFAITRSTAELQSRQALALLAQLAAAAACAAYTLPMDDGRHVLLTEICLNGICAIVWARMPRRHSPPLLVAASRLTVGVMLLHDDWLMVFLWLSGSTTPSKSGLLSLLMNIVPLTLFWSYILSATIWFSVWSPLTRVLDSVTGRAPWLGFLIAAPFIYLFFSNRKYFEVQ